MDFSKLALLRNNRNWTQQELAERADISRFIISDLENDKRRLTPKTTAKLAKAFGVTADEFLKMII